MTEKDYYEILGVDKGATTRQITTAKSKGIQRWHPDKHNNETEEIQENAKKETQRINEAYETLSDASKRAEYDHKHGFTGTEKKPGAKTTSSSAAGKQPEVPTDSESSAAEKQPGAPTDNLPPNLPDFEPTPSDADYYETLGIARTVTQSQINAAYKKKIKQLRPELYRNEPKELVAQEIQRVNEAYAVLGEEQKRAAYDDERGYTVKSAYWAIDLSADRSRTAHIENILHAAQEGNIADVTHFVGLNKNDVNAEDRWGNTPLHYAAWFNPDVTVLQYLIEKGGEVGALNHCGRAPLDVASTEAKRKILRGAR